MLFVTERTLGRGCSGVRVRTGTRWAHEMGPEGKEKFAMRTKQFLFAAVVGILVILTVNARAQVGAHETICRVGQEPVCLIRSADGVKVATDGRGHAVREHEACRSTTTEVRFGCLPSADILREERAECEELCYPFRWSDQRNRCFEQREGRDSDPTSPPAQNPQQQSQVIIVPQDCPSCPPLPPPQGGGCTPDEVGRIERELARLERGLAVITEGACLEQAGALYGESVRCGGDVLSRARDLVAACDQIETTPPAPVPQQGATESTPPVTPVTPPAQQNPLAPPPPEEDEDESWCSENPGICTVIIIGAVLGATALGVGLYEALKPTPEVTIDHDYHRALGLGVSW